MGQSDLPVASCDAHVRAFMRLGWIRQPKRGKGSHIIMTKPGQRATLTIPGHREVKRALLAKLIQAAGETVESYCEAFNR